MKTLKNTLMILFVLVSTMASAQTDKYVAAMKKGLTLLDSAKNEQGFLAAANHFERVANVENKQWLPIYYAAYSNLMSALTTKDQSKKDEIFDKVLDQVNQANALAANNSEIYALKGYAQFMKMTVNPQARLGLIGEANASFAKSEEIDPTNPRPYFIAGQNTFYTPEAFGGGKAKAKPMLEEAKKKYTDFELKDQLAPNWGEKRCLQLLEQCK